MKRGCADDDNQDLYRHAGGGAALGDISPVAGDVFVHGGEGDDFDPMEIWLECVDHQDAEDLHLTPSVDHHDFPPLPVDYFPCMSSSSSTSSAPAAAGHPKPASSSTASSSSSAASWAILKSDPNEDAAREFRLAMAAAAPSSVSFDGGAPPLPEDSFTEDDCINVIDSLDDFINGDDGLWDMNCSIFQTSDGFQEVPTEFPAAAEDLKPDESHVTQQEEDKKAAENAEEPPFLQGNGELAAIFFDWLKQNKEYISAEEVRSIKLRRSTIESAFKRLGNTKEAKKQLLKLILLWVQQNQLQKKMTSRQAAAAGDEADPLLSAVCNFPPPDTAPPAFFYHQNPYIPAVDPNMMVAGQPPYPVFPPPPPGMGYAGNNVIGVADPYNNYCGASYPPMNSCHFLRPMDSNQSWPSSTEFPAASQPFNPFPDGNNNNNNNNNKNGINGTVVAGSDESPGLFGSEFPYQLFDGNGERLVRLGSSATKEARKKRMARQRKMSSHHFRHQNNSNTIRLGGGGGVEKCSVAHHHHHRQVVNNGSKNNFGNWMYWSPTVSNARPPPPQATPPVVKEAPRQQPQQPPPVDRQPLVEPQQNHPKLGSLDRREIVKTEKNLKFLLQKVLKQSDVGGLGRIVLPKKEAETQLPELESRDGISIAMEDIGTSRVWNMKYRFWPNNKSRMYLLENTGDFVRENGLQEGDFIVIYADTKSGKFMIRGVKVRQNAPRSEAKKPMARKSVRPSPATFPGVN